MTEFYSQDDIQQILQIAIARQADAGELTRAQLFEIADEMGISQADLQFAEQEWRMQQGEAQERLAFLLYRRGRFYKHATRFLIVNAFLIALNVIATGGLSWSLYIALVWGLGLALNAWKTFHAEGEDFEAAFQTWRRRRWLKQSVNSFLNRWMRARQS